MEYDISLLLPFETDNVIPIGAIGSQGPTGIQGIDGIQGPTGIQGIQGDTGLTGSQGIQGLKGSTGVTGDPGGSDWTIVRLNSDIATISSTGANVTGMGFTPDSNKNYEFEMILLLESNNSSSGFQFGLTWPTGLVEGAANFVISYSDFNTTYKNVTKNDTTFTNGVSSSVSDIHLAIIGGLIVTGVSSSGAIQLTFRAEIDGATMTVKAGSLLKYRLN